MSYSDLTFPYHCKNMRGASVIVLGRVGDYLIGATYIEGLLDDKLSCVTPCRWTAMGRFIDDQTVCPSDLPPLGDQRSFYREHLLHCIAVVERRMADFPHSAPHHQAADKRELIELQKQLEKLDG